MEQFYPLLSRTLLFGGIEKAELEALLGCLQARVVAVKKGDPLFLEGDEAGFVGVVLEGSIQIFQEDYYGNRSLLSVAEEGDIFAEAFACAGVKEMPVSGYAARDSRIMLLSCGKMLTVCSHSCRFHNRLVKNLLQLVAQKNLGLNRKIGFMAQKTTKEKLMAYLLDQAKAAGSPEFTIPLDRQALADYLGVERSAMSAELSKLRRDGFLECKGPAFKLL